MKIKKFISFVGMAFVFLGFMNMETEAAIRAKTVVIKYIDIKYEVNKAELSGKAWARDVKKEEISQIEWSIIDNYGAKIWTENVSWSDEFAFKAEKMTGEQVVIPFLYDFSEKNVSGDFKLIFLIKNKKGDLIAQGQKEITISQSKEFIANISSLKFERGDKVVGSFLLFQEGVNNTENFKFKPVINLFENNERKELIYSHVGETQELLGTGKKQITFEFDTPKIPNIYILEVKAVDENEKDITGSLSRPFLIDGDYADIKLVMVEPSKFFKKGDEAAVRVEGTVRNTQDTLGVKMIVNQMYGGSVQETFTKEFINVKLRLTDEFREEFTFKVGGEGADQFQLEASVIQNGEVIETRKETTEQISHLLDVSVEEKTGATKITIADFLAKKNLLIAGGVVILLILIVIMITRRKSRIDLILIFAPLIFFGGMTHAAYNTWLSPANELAINPNASGDNFDDFRYIGFQGTLTYVENGDGILNPAGTTVIITLTDEGSNSYSSEAIDISGDLYIGSSAAPNAEYRFAIDIYNDFQGTDGVPPDGLYEVEIEFFITDYPAPDPGEESVIAAPSSSIQLIVDTEKPTIEITYYKDVAKTTELLTGDFTNQPVQVSITCNDGTNGAGCFYSGALGTSFDLFGVKGNFCAEGTTGYEYCRNTLPRGFKIYDKVGNYTVYGDNEMDITFYDDSPLTLSDIALESLGLVSSPQMEARLESTLTFDVGDGLSGTLHQDPCDENRRLLETRQFEPDVVDNACTTRKLPCKTSYSGPDYGERDQDGQDGDCDYQFPLFECSNIYFPMCFPIDLQ